MYSSNFVTLNQKEKRRSEQTVSVPNEAEHASLSNQQNLEDCIVKSCVSFYPSAPLKKPSSSRSQIKHVYVEVLLSR